MQLPRSGQLDDRRRRVLTEDLIGSAVSAESSSARRAGLRGSAGKNGSAPHPGSYGDAAQMDRQPHVTDLIPQRYSLFCLLFLAGGAVIAGLEALYAWMPDLAGMTTDGRVAAFDLDGEGGLAVWFSSMLLALAGMVALLIYSIRRHKADDYHGRYRVWAWAAAMWFVMSIDEGGSLHEGFKELMAHVTGQRLFGDGSIWWIGPYFAILGVLGIRLLLEMRDCRLSTAALMATAGCFAVAVLTQLGWIMPDSGARGVMLEEGCEMAGDLFLLLTMGLYARHVILDVQGLLPPKLDKPRKIERPVKAKASSGEGPAAKKSWFRRAKVDAPHTSPPKPAKRGDLEPLRHGLATDISAEHEEPEADDELYGFDYDEPAGGIGHPASQGARAGETRKMTKAERKALRREQQRDRRL